MSSSPGDLSESAVHLLAALIKCDRMEVVYPAADPPVLVVWLSATDFLRVADADLAALCERALVTLGDENPATGMPDRITVTLYGKTFLKRWMLANRKSIAFYELKSPGT